MYGTTEPDVHVYYSGLKARTRLNTKNELV